MNYYNDNDPFVCEWLKNLVAEKIIPPGDVDGRSILEITGKELRGYEQCHFFAGVGGWPIALELAGWGARRPVWTGSCPCQPLSLAGNHQCEKDERHLWPEFFRLIKECKPPTIFGEQVASEDGRDWLAALRLDLETLDYACGASDLCAAGVGAPHVRQRLWWVADTNSSGRSWERSTQSEKRRSNPVATGKGEAIPNSNEEGQSDIKGCSRPPRQSWRGESGADDAERRPQQWISEPEMVRVVHGVSANPHSVGAYGNAIVPQVGAEFIEAFMEAINE